jgi:hypothetical protein
MKFSELLGEPDSGRELPAEESEPISVFAPVPVATPPPEAAVAYPTEPPEPVAYPTEPPEPVAYPTEPPDADAVAGFEPPTAPETVVAPEPPFVPEPVVAPRTGLAEVNVRQEPEPVAPEPEPAGFVPGLADVDDDLLPSSYRRGRR